MISWQNHDFIQQRPSKENTLGIEIRETVPRNSGGGILVLIFKLLQSLYVPKHEKCIIGTCHVMENPPVFWVDYVLLLIIELIWRQSERAYVRVCVNRSACRLPVCVLCINLDRKIEVEWATIEIIGILLFIRVNLIPLTKTGRMFHCDRLPTDSALVPKSQSSCKFVANCKFL